METGEESPVRVEETRRRAEKLVVEDNGQASGLFRNITEKAKDGWGKMRKILEGRKLVWKGSTGKVVVMDQDKRVNEEVGEVNVGEEWSGGTVEVMEDKVDVEEERGGGGRGP